MEVDLINQRVFRPHWSLLIVGTAFVCFGVLGQMIFLGEVMAGNPIPVRHTRGGQIISERFATPLETWLIGFFVATFWIVGLVMLAWSINAEARVNEDGITVRTILRKEIRLGWDQITYAKRMNNKGTYFWRIGNDDTRVLMPSGENELDEILKRRLGHLVPRY